MRIFLFLTIIMVLSGCFNYSFTGTSIPQEIDSIFIPFFADQSSSGIGTLSDQLNQILVNRFVNQTRLTLANNRDVADALLEGEITSYTNRPFSVSSAEQAERNQVTITIRATFRFTGEEEAEWNSFFSGTSTYDPNVNPIEGEQAAADEALEQIANNMFNDAVSGW